MNQIAQILFEYNEGINVIQTFVIKNDIVIENEEKSLDEQEWALLADSRRSDFKIDEQATFDTLKFEIKSRARISKKVFADPTPVIKIFIQRMYAQIIRNKVTSLLQKSLSVSPLAHVRVLHSLYTLVGDFTEQIKDYLTTEELDKDQELSAILTSHIATCLLSILATMYISTAKRRTSKRLFMGSFINSTLPTKYNCQ